MNESNIYRNAGYGEKLIEAIRNTITRPWRIMDTCGGQTFSIAKYRIEEMLPDGITLIHGPGCPVCVTPSETIDLAIDLALNSNVIIVSFGDMLRVPGESNDLLTAKAMGGDIRTIYSPLDALRIAEENPGKEVVLLAIGFETTAPIHAQVVLEATKRNIRNLSLLTALFAVPPVLEALFAMPDFSVDGILAAGHVCTITGLKEYERLAGQYKIPIAVTGFEPVDILWGIYSNIKQLEKGDYHVDNAYSRMVPQEGNVKARQALYEVFDIQGQAWRGLGYLSGSGFRLKDRYASFDTMIRFGKMTPAILRDEICISGEIMKGNAKPEDCPNFGKKCHPSAPLGAPMVSSEGVCAAYFKYKIHE
ncbi:MAG: hydrogenase formation protein HypD [Bacteroidales bacterium]